MVKNRPLKSIICSKKTVIIGLMAMLQVFYIQAQELQPAPPDSLALPTIPLERIPIVSGETGLKIIRLNESLISSEQIEQEKTRKESTFLSHSAICTSNRSME